MAKRTHEEEEEKKVAVPKVIGGTKHLGANVGDFAEVCLLPGDPLRAKVIADNCLTDVKLVTTVRNMFGYTGFYKGKRVSVCGTGMGMPSHAIYVTELITHYGVKKLIRTGSCGTVCYPRVKLGDLVIGIGAGTDSTMNRIKLCNFDQSATADFGLLSTAVKVCEETPGLLTGNGSAHKYHVSRFFSTDTFYHPMERELYPLLKKFDYAGIEMEAAVLYGLGMEHNVKTLAICTVSDELRLPEGYPKTGNIEFHEMSAKERETSMQAMFTVALDTAVA